MASGRSKGGTNRKYSPEFKIQVVESIEKGNLNVKEACRLFGLLLASGYENTHPVRTWRRIYLEMENEYPKKLDALVRQRERGAKKSPK